MDALKKLALTIGVVVCMLSIPGCATNTGIQAIEALPSGVSGAFLKEGVLWMVMARDRIIVSANYQGVEIPVLSSGSYLQINQTCGVVSLTFMDERKADLQLPACSLSAK